METSTLSKNTYNRALGAKHSPLNDITLGLTKGAIPFEIT